jgi:hypothetical protein
MDDTTTKAIDNVRKALAMREAGYAALPDPDDVAALLWAYDVLNIHKRGEA